MLTANQVKEKLSVENVIQLCCDLQGDDVYYYDSQNHPMFLTSLDHEGGDSYKEVYYHETKLFYCFTRGTSYDIFELVQRAKHFSTFREAFEFVCNYFDIVEDSNCVEKEPVLADNEIFLQLEEYNKTSSIEQNPPIADNLLEFFSRDLLPYEWTKEHITLSTMSYFKICLEPALQKIIIPHYNIRGELIGIRSRNYNPFEVEAGLKYTPVQIENTWLKHKLGLNLYGIYENLSTIKKIKKVVIFEAEKSVLQVASYYGVKNNWSLATCGSNLSQEQMDLLLSIGVEEVILAYDKEYKDGPGEKEYSAYLNKLYEHVQYLTQYVRVYIIMDKQNLLQYKDSPSDRGQEVFEKLLHQKIYAPCIYNTKIIKRTKKGGREWKKK